MRISYAICSWGLGHTTRSAPLIDKLLKEGHKVDVICSGRSYDFLKGYLKSDDVDYIRYPEPSNPFSAGDSNFTLNFLRKTPSVLKSIIDERRMFRKYFEKVRPDMVISDSRFGIDTPKVPSYFITNQLRLISPMIYRPMSLTELLNLSSRNYKKFIVSDFRDEEESTTGGLNHGMRFIDERRVDYVGVISDFKYKDAKKDIDCMISISGPEPTRTDFEKKIFEQIDDLEGKVVVSLGKPGSGNVRSRDNAEVYDFMDKETREDLMNRAKLIVTRSGHSTIMDMYALKKRPLFIPTPGQTEQEYLARYLNGKKIGHFVPQKDMNLAEDARIAKSYKGFTRDYDTRRSVNRFMDAIFN